MIHPEVRQFMQAYTLETMTFELTDRLSSMWPVDDAELDAWLAIAAYKRFIDREALSDLDRRSHSTPFPYCSAYAMPQP